MPWRFRQSLRLLPGVRLNIGKQSMSLSVGGPGATLNLSRRGVRGTVGLPGSGLSYTHDFSGGRRGAAPLARSRAAEPVPAVPARPIASADLGQLTSAGRAELARTIAEARDQRLRIEAAIADADDRAARDQGRLDRRNGLLKPLFGRRIAELEAALAETAAEQARLAEWWQASHVDLAIGMTPAATSAWAALAAAFDALAGCRAAWDVTAAGPAPPGGRGPGGEALVREPVTLARANSGLLRWDGTALRLANINGFDLYIYPGLVLKHDAAGRIAVIDLRDITARFVAVDFPEPATPPADAAPRGHVWARANRDGSPDRRFRDNWQIPLFGYGSLHLTSVGGLDERWLFSRDAPVADFVTAWDAARRALDA